MLPDFYPNQLQLHWHLLLAPCSDLWIYQAWLPSQCQVFVKILSYSDSHIINYKCIAYKALSVHSSYIESLGEESEKGGDGCQLTTLTTESEWVSCLVKPGHKVGADLDNTGVIITIARTRLPTCGCCWCRRVTRPDKNIQPSTSDNFFPTRNPVLAMVTILDRL